MEVKKQSLVQNDKSEECLVLQERVEELNVQLTQVQEEKELLEQGKVYLSVVLLALRIGHIILRAFTSSGAIQMKSDFPFASLRWL
jgi:hypothetical protein